MAYRMKELTTTVRVGQRGDGSLDIEVWQTPRGWLPETDAAEDMPEQVIVPADAVDLLFAYLR